MDVSDSSSWIGIPTISAFIAAVLLFLFYGLKQRKNLPPGPTSFPLIGSIPSIITRWYPTGDRPEKFFAKMAGDYGELFTINFGPQVVLVANGYKSIKEACKNPLLTDRPQSKLMEAASMDTGVALTNGKAWLHQRKFTTKTLRDFGVGKTSFEGHISAEAKILIDEMSKNKDKPFQPRTLIMKCVSNILCGVVFGERFNHTDPKFEHLLNSTTDVIEASGSGSLLYFFPIAKYIFPKHYNTIKAAFLEMIAFVKGTVDEHTKIFEETNLKDFIDVFLREIELSKTEGDRSDFINTKALLATVVTLFLGGTETTSTTLNWTFLYMVMYPDVQAKVQEEMDRIVGRHRMPQWADRCMLPYTEAVLHELQRIRTVAPLSVPHLAAEDTQLAGYDVPKDAIIITNLWALHNDPDVWPEPDRFKPERFLDENGKLCVPKEYAPFGSGRRICLGDNLANMEVFLFVTIALHKYVFKKQPGCSYSLEMEKEGSNPATPYEIIAESRE